MRRPLAALGLSALSACSLFTDLGGFSGGGASDAATPSESGSPADGASDAPADAPATDAGGDADATAAKGCAGKPGALFCIDFDGPEPLAAPHADRWDGIAGTVALSSTSFSPPSAAEVTVAPDASCAFSIMTKKFPGAWSSGRLEMMMRVEAVTSLVTVSFPLSADTAYNAIATLPQASLSQLYLQKYSQTTGSTDIASSDGQLGASALDRWVPVVIGFESLPKKRVYLRVDGVEASDDLPAEVPLSGPVFNLGMWCESRASKELVDDAAFYLTP